MNKGFAVLHSGQSFAVVITGCLQPRQIMIAEFEVEGWVEGLLDLGRNLHIRLSILYCICRGLLLCL